MPARCAPVASAEVTRAHILLAKGEFATLSAYPALPFALQLPVLEDQSRQRDPQTRSRRISHTKYPDLDFRKTLVLAAGSAGKKCAR
jgi:hypothetical protein